MFVSAPIKAKFVEPMLLQRTDSLPDDTHFVYEVKLDGYRALGIKNRWKGIPPVAQQQGLQFKVSRHRHRAGNITRRNSNRRRACCPGRLRTALLQCVAELRFIEGADYLLRVRRTDPCRTERHVRTPFGPPRSATAPHSSEARRTDP